MAAIEFDAEWQRSSPFGAVFFFERAVKGLVGNLPQLGGTVALLVTLWRESPWLALLGFVGLLALCAAVGLLRYWHFRFRQDERGVRIRQGIFKKEHLDVEYDRIQGINVEQSLIFRLLGLVTVRFDTAGSTKQEGHLPAVTREFAEALRGRVENRAWDDGHAAAADASAAAGAPEARGGRVLLALGNADMLRIAVTDPSVLVALVAVPALLPPYGDALKDLAEAAMAQAADYQNLGAALLAAVLLGVALAGLSILLLLAVCSTFLRFHGYQLRLEENTLRSRGGLMTRKEVVVAAAKIQQVTVVQGPVLRMLGRFRLRALPAGSGIPAYDMDGTAGTQRLQVPLLLPALAQELRKPIFGDEGAGLSMLPTGSRFTAISPHYIRARTLAFGVAPALVATAAAVPILGAGALAFLAWAPLVALLAWQSWRHYGYMHDDHGLASRWGFLGRKVSVCLFRKVQAVTVVRSPMQRRKGLATLHVHLASGALLVPFIDYRRACELRDYMLYKAESSRLPWH